MNFLSVWSDRFYGWFLRGGRSFSLIPNFHRTLSNQRIFEPDFIVQVGIGLLNLDDAPTANVGNLPLVHPTHDPIDNHVMLLAGGLMGK